MQYRIEKVDVWMGFIKHAPGELGTMLTSLSQTGSNLEFVFARPTDKGDAVCFVAPLKGRTALKVAKSLGMVKCQSLLSVRVEGPNKAGIGAKITTALGAQGINIQGLSAMGIGKSALAYIALEKADISKALRVLKTVLH
jgi:hypothetical protein